MKERGPVRQMNVARLRWLVSLPTVADPKVCCPWPFASDSPEVVPAFTLFGRQTTAARAALMLATNRDPDGLYACHDPRVCYNAPNCVNPHHLRWATPSENSLDRAIAVDHATQLADLAEQAKRLPPPPAPPADCWP